MECKLTEPREIKFSNYLLVIFWRLKTQFLNISHISYSKLVWARRVKRQTSIWHSISSPTIGAVVTQATASVFIRCSWEILVDTSSTNKASFTQFHRKKFGDPVVQESHMSAFLSVPRRICRWFVSYTEDKLLPPDECAGAHDTAWGYQENIHKF
jgi:hypothetical protein